VCECAGMRRPFTVAVQMLSAAWRYTVCFAALNFNTHNASSCQAITESLLPGCAFGKPDNVLIFPVFFFFGRGSMVPQGVCKVQVV